MARHRYLLGAALALALGWPVPRAQAQLQWPGCADLKASDFRKVVLLDRVKDPSLTEPVKLAVAPDGRVLLLERRGRLKIIKPDPATAVTAWEPKVFWEKYSAGGQAEDGLLGLALDPGFAANGWIYVLYSPLEKKVQRLARFTLKGDRLDTLSQRILLEVEVQRDYCCHTGGAMAFDAQGNLYVTLGDNTNGNTGNFSIRDERPGQAYLDAQRTAANTDDLRGKVLRIRPEASGAVPYSIPAGNLFPILPGGQSGTAKTRPEIYSMGHRQPYTLAVDRYRGWLAIGEVGPGETAPDPLRGPATHEELNLVRKPGNFGWPYFIGPNLAYRAYDYATKVSGPAYDPVRPMNASPNNTGLAELPPAQPAHLSWERGVNQGKTVDNLARWPGLDGSSIITGPLYHYDGANPSRIKLPPHFDKKWLFSDWWASWIRVATLDDKGDRVIDLQRVSLDFTLANPIAMETGPDGALYIIEYAGNFTSTGSTRVVRMEYTGTCLPPNPVPVAIAAPNMDPGRGARHGGLRIHLQGFGSREPSSGSLSGPVIYDVRGSRRMPGRIGNGLYLLPQERP